MKNYRVLLIAFFLGITIFSVFKYLTTLREKYDLLHDLNKAKEKEVSLLHERQNLLQALEKQKWVRKKLLEENTIIRDDLRGAKENLSKLTQDFSEAQGEIEDLNAQIASLKTESTGIRQEIDELNTQLTQASQEKETLLARLNSITELENAIRELRKKVRTKVEIQQEVRIQPKPVTKRAPKGNKGFLLRAGKSTFPTKAKIEVNLFPPTP